MRGIPWRCLRSSLSSLTCGNAHTRMRAPKVTEKLVPVFTSEELSALEKTCQGRTFAQRRDTAIITVLTVTGIRAAGAAELAAIRYDAHNPRRSDLDLRSREITVRG